MRPRVTIIIPCFNQAEFLDRCLASLQEQTFKDWDCVIIDDGSTDLTATIARSWQKHEARFQYFYKKNGGVSSARNLGIEKSKGEFIIFVDCDDILFGKESLANFAAEINSDIDLISANFYLEKSTNELVTPSDNEIIACRQELKKEEILEYCLLQKISGIGCNKMIRKRILVDSNIRYNERMLYSEDFHFFLNLYTFIDKMVLLPAYTYCYNRTNINSASATALNSYSSKSNWYASQMIFIKSIVEHINNSDRWALIDPKYLKQYFAHQYGFLKDDSFLKRKKEWLESYSKIQKFYKGSRLNDFEKKFKYNPWISYISFKTAKKLKNRESVLYKFLCKFISF